MKTLITRSSLALSLLMLLSATPALAQVSFGAAIDCGGVFAPGSAVPFTVRFENQTLQTIPLNVRVIVRVPVIGRLTIGQSNLTLGSNQDLTFNLTLNLPNRAPNGGYVMAIIARSPDEMTFDTCSFDVQ
jgi:hypothetical protein